MDIIIVSHRQGRTWRFAFEPSRLLGWLPLAFGVLALGATGFAAGYSARGDRSALAPALVEQWSEDLQIQRAGVAEARAVAEEQARALARHIAQLQAHVTRLDAAGQRLTEMAGLEQGEFDFANPPALGGPAVDADPSPQALSNALLSLADVERQLSDRERQMRVLEDLLLVGRVQKDLQPSGWPVVAGYVSSVYGYRTDPFSGRRALHSGVDFAGSAGSDVVAVASGIVSGVVMHPAYGRMVEISHGNGYVTRYAHNRKVLVEAGQRVMRGQPIAQMGNSGRASGTHVHFEVLLNGRIVNPAQYIRDAAG